jgi:hypothetical protein
MDKIMKNSNMKVDTCRRCHDQKELNKFGLCKACQMEVEHEYALLYRVKDMEY